MEKREDEREASMEANVVTTSQNHQTFPSFLSNYKRNWGALKFSGSGITNIFDFEEIKLN